MNRSSSSGAAGPPFENTTTTAASSSQPQSKRFSSILVARPNQVRPSELEVHLRQHCQRLRVIEKLNGAHVVIPGETTLALRAYYPTDLKQQQQPQQQQSDSSSKQTVPHDKVLQQIHNHTQQQQQSLDESNPELNGLRLFQRSFAVTLVFFVLPQDSPERQQQYDNIGSFMHRATSLLLDQQNHSSSSSSSSNSSSSSSKKAGGSVRVTRVFAVQDTAEAIETIMVLADALSPDKRRLKRLFFHRQRIANFMPLLDSSSNVVTNNRSNQQQQQQQQQQMDVAAASHAAGAFRDWARQYELPPGEADVLMSWSGSSLQDILTASQDQLSTIPMEDRTRKLLQSFFESSPSPPSGATNDDLVGQDQYYYSQNQDDGPFTGAADTVGPGAVWDGNAEFVEPPPTYSYNPSYSSMNPPAAGQANNMMVNNNHNSLSYNTYQNTSVVSAAPTSMYPSNNMAPAHPSMMTQPRMTSGQQQQQQQSSMLATGGYPSSMSSTFPNQQGPGLSNPSAYDQQRGGGPYYQQQQQPYQQQHPSMMMSSQGPQAYLQGAAPGTSVPPSTTMLPGGSMGRGGAPTPAPFQSQRKQMARWM